MNRRQPPRRIINHYATWQYVVLIVAVVLLALSAVPTWYGEKPSVQLSAHQGSQLQSVTQMQAFLQQHHLNARRITRENNVMTLVFNDETSQTKARQLLDSSWSDKADINYSYLSMAPQWLGKLGFAPIKLGLDLRGGVQFLLHVDVAHAFSEQRDAMVDDIDQMLQDKRLHDVKVAAAGTEDILVQSTSAAQLDSISQFFERQYPQWDLTHDKGTLRAKPSDSRLSEFKDSTIEQNLKTMRGRIEELGITEASVQRQGSDNIRIELPGVQDPAQAKNILGATATLAFYEVKDKKHASKHDLVIKNRKGEKVILARHPVLTGDHIVNALAGTTRLGFSEVDITLDHSGGKLMSAFTGSHIGKPMATVYREYTRDKQGNVHRSEQVISQATIRGKLASQFRITGSGSIADSRQLALLLRAGSLTAPVTIVEERTIGASLGVENIHNGFAALALGMGLTLLFMALWYRRLGWVADVALCINMVCLLGMIALLPGAILTLPGIAGLVLTVGMAVDTNVLIFERIRDALAEGLSMAQSIDIGFSSAFRTILDANITTMITAVILYSMGDGPIQGFALTLGLGLITSMFSGIFVSRALINIIWGHDARHGVRV